MSSTSMIDVMLLNWIWIKIRYFQIECKQARKLQATLEGCNPKLSPTDSLTDMGKV